jgi:hypothetical protein
MEDIPVITNKRHYTLAIWSLVCGGVGLITCCLGIPLGIAAVILGVMSLNAENHVATVERSGKTMAIVGIVLGAMAFCTGILGGVFWAAFYAGFSNAAKQGHHPW